MKKRQQQQAWPKEHRLFTLLAISWMALNVAATDSGILNDPEPGGEKKTMSRVVVQGVVYCAAPSQHHELLKDAEVQVECTNQGTKARKAVGKTNAQGTFSIILQDYDYEAWGSNGCKAKLISSTATTCTIPTNMGGGLTGTNLVLKEKSHAQVVLTAGPFAFEKNLQKRVATKDSLPAGSELWYHYTSPPPYHHKSREHHKSDHKAREKDCHPHHKSHEYKSPPHYKFPPPPYHSAPRHDSSPYYYKSPPYHYTFPPPAHMSPPYIPYVHHTPSPIYKYPPPPPHDNYEAPPKQYYPPPYYQKPGGMKGETKGNSP